MVDWQKFADIVGTENFTDDYIKRLCYSRDMSVHEGVPDAVIFPTTTEQVQKIMKIANTEKIPIVPRGSGTSVTGAIVANEGGIVLDMSKMNRIKEINVGDRYAVVEPGVICGDLIKALAPDNFFPPDPGSSAVATIGGMVNTNASGLRAVKYGTTKDHVLALEAVLPDGEVYRTGTLAPKTSSGYDLTSLLVNSEGTLGIITEVTVKISPVPEYIAFATASFAKIEQAGQAISKMLSVGIPIACAEIVDKICIGVLREKMGLDLPEGMEGTLIVEVDGAEPAVTKDMKNIMEICNEFKGIEVRWSDNPEERLQMWKDRGGLVANLSRYTPGKRLIPIAEDFGVPITQIPEAIKRIQQIARAHDIIIATFGHVGDGNLHSTFIIDVRDEEEWKKIEQVGNELINMALELGGTITAEHASGLAKAPFIERELGNSIEVMRAIKKAIDPNNILNPGKMALDKKPHKMYDYFAFENFLKKGQAHSFSKSVDDEILACIQCGFCRAGCPTFEVTNMESLNARGRILLAFDIISGKEKPSAELAEPLYSCTTCMNCTMVCPPGIKVVEIMEAARAEFNKRGIIRPEHQKIYENIAEHHNPFGESPETRNKLKSLSEEGE